MVIAVNRQEEIAEPHPAAAEGQQAAKALANIK
jgi:hypothetical protein